EGKEPGKPPENLSEELSGKARERDEVSSEVSLRKFFGTRTNRGHQSGYNLGRRCVSLSQLPVGRASSRWRENTCSKSAWKRSKEPPPRSAAAPTASNCARICPWAASRQAASCCAACAREFVPQFSL